MSDRDTPRSGDDGSGSAETGPADISDLAHLFEPPPGHGEEWRHLNQPNVRPDSDGYMGAAFVVTLLLVGIAVLISVFS